MNSLGGLGDDVAQGAEKSDHGAHKERQRRNVGLLLLGDVALVGILAHNVDGGLPEVTGGAAHLAAERHVLLAAHLAALQLAILGVVKELSILPGTRAGKVESGQGRLLLAVLSGLVHLAARGSGGLLGAKEGEAGLGGAGFSSTLVAGRCLVVKRARVTMLVEMARLELKR